MCYRLGEMCSHVAALLFKVEACVRLGIASMTCTSLPCAWNQAFSKKVYNFYTVIHCMANLCTIATDITSSS